MINYGLTFDQYCKILALNRSTLEKIKHSPSHVNYAENYLKAEEPSLAMKLGTIAHDIILNKRPPLDCVDERFVPRPKGMKFNTVEGKLWRKEQTKEIIEEADYEFLIGGSEAVAKHAIAKDVFSEGDAEVTSVVFDPQHGIALKARFDWLPKESNVVVELKTAEDASKEAFSRALHRLGYVFQAGFYTHVAELEKLNRDVFLFVVVEKRPPYEVVVYRLDDESLKIGKEEVRQCLELYRGCKEAKKWPGYSDKIETIGLPEYVKERNMFFGI